MVSSIKKRCKKATGVCKSKPFLGSQLWKLEGNMLLNKEGLWTSDDIWNFKINLFNNDSEPVKGKENWIYTENRSKAKYFGIKQYGSEVILESGQVPQQWIQGVPNAEGYFTLKSVNFYSDGKVITAISSSGLEVRGNITLR